MPHSPSIVPEHTDREIYIVLDDFGLLAKVWRETNDADADRETLIQDLLDGQYEEPVRIVQRCTLEEIDLDVVLERAHRQHVAVV